MGRGQSVAASALATRSNPPLGIRTPESGLRDQGRTESNMASKQRHNDGQGHGHRGGDNAAGARAPEWADGLKQLYDSVVEEDLPDTFKDLLSRLDAINQDSCRTIAGPSADGRDASR